MVRIRIGVTRYASLLGEIERRLAPEGMMTCRLGVGRVYLVLRGAGATQWEPARRLATALDMAAVVRSILAADSRAPVRYHAHHAVVVRYEDAGVAEGCEVRAHWECIVPGA